MAEIRPTSDGADSRRDFLRKSLLAGGVAASAPVIATFHVPAGAQAGSGPTPESLSFTIGAYTGNPTATNSAAAPDGTSSVISGGAGCVLAGYSAGEVPAYGGTVSATRTNGGGAETATITITGLPSAGTCSVSVIARCGPDATGECVTGTGTKAVNATTAIVNLSAACAANGGVGFRKFYVTVTC